MFPLKRAGKHVPGDKRWKARNLCNLCIWQPRYQFLSPLPLREREPCINVVHTASAGKHVTSDVLLVSKCLVLIG